MTENPVSDVVRVVRDGEKVVVFAKITIGLWTFRVVRGKDGNPLFEGVAYFGGDQVYNKPPDFIKAKAYPIAKELFSEARPISLPYQGVLIPAR